MGGRMVLIFLGRRGPEHVDRGNSFFWEILSRAFAILVSQVHTAGGHTIIVVIIFIMEAKKLKFST